MCTLSICRPPCLQRDPAFISVSFKVSLKKYTFISILAYEHTAGQPNKTVGLTSHRGEILSGLHLSSLITFLLDPKSTGSGGVMLHITMYCQHHKKRDDGRLHKGELQQDPATGWGGGECHNAPQPFSLEKRKCWRRCEWNAKVVQ